MKNEHALQKLNEKMHASNTCALKRTALNPVYGKGSATAEIIFVGEAPGKKEDATGEPFVGAAGKMLSNLLESIGLSRDDIYITNTVKYRPPDNRDPLPEEVVACWPWLEAQVELIDPVLIVPLGRHALERFIPGQKISEAHGKVFTCEVSGLVGRNVLALYHPAAALYNGSLRETLFSDVKQIPALLRKIKKVHQK